jgi:hypothetical protein
MGFLLTLLLHVMLIGSMLAFTAASVFLISKAQDPQDRWIRIGAFFAGAMIVMGANAAGLTFAEFIVDALSNNSPGATTAAAVVPTALGLGAGAYLTRSARRHGVVAERIMILIGMLASVQFTYIYLAALDRKGFELGATAIPNMSFSVGIILYLVLNHGVQPKKPPPVEGRDPRSYTNTRGPAR